MRIRIRFSGKRSLTNYAGQFSSPSSSDKDTASEDDEEDMTLLATIVGSIALLLVVVVITLLVVRSIAIKEKRLDRMQLRLSTHCSRVTTTLTK